jgi:glycosyltransferase involved in cell wall biosynthesis
VSHSSPLSHATKARVAFGSGVAGDVMGVSRVPHTLRLLSLNTDLPIFPGGGGVEYLTLLQTRSLAGTIGLVSMAHTRDHLARAAGLRAGGIHLYLWESPFIDAAPAARRSRNALVMRAHRALVSISRTLRAGLWRPRDTMIMDGAFRNLAPALTTALGDGPWHVVSYVQSSAAIMREYMPEPWVSVLVLHDIRSVLYRRRARAARTLWSRWRFSDEARRYEAFERELCQRFDLIVTVSDHDAAWVLDHYTPRRVVAVPLPIDAGYFAAQPAAAEVPGRIVFSGLMSHPPNADAAVHFARDVFPAVRRQVPLAEFWVVGREPTASVQALADLPGITVTGEVPDIRPHLASATVVVVPLTYGSGSRQKILEAWAVERCVVSTSVGAEGLHFVDGVHLAVADGAEKMAAMVVRALTDDGFRDGLRHAGRTIAATMHDPAVTARTYYNAVCATAAEKAAQAEPMRVALDMRWMVPGLAGGLEQLARAFLNELMVLDRSNSYVAILPARSRHDFPFDRTDSVRPVCLDSIGAYLQRGLRQVTRRLAARLHLDDWQTPEVVRLRWLRALNVDIAYSFPGYIHPDLWPLRHVLIVPDIQHEYFPEFFTEQAVAERQRLFGESIRHADHICAISEFTRQSLIDRLGTAPERITTVPLAADSIFNATASPGDRSIVEKYGLRSRGYLFLPAHTWHHKNHRAALSALRILRDKHGLTIELVCTGGAREGQADLDRQVEAEHLAVRFLGYCARAELPALYRQAACLVFPSLFEGFGMPVLEAMACGCPVVCSNTTSLPEIAGDAALLVDPVDHEALADGIATILRSPDLRTDLEGRGVRQAARFSWRRHTTETVRVLHRVHQQLRKI